MLIRHARGLCVAIHCRGQLGHAGNRLLQACRLLLGAACELQVVRRQGLPRMRDQGGVAAYVGHHGGQREHHAIELQAHVRQFIRTLQLHARAQIAMCRPMH